MKDEIKIGLISALFILGISYLFFNINFIRFTGQVVLESDIENGSVFTHEDALISIEEAKGIIIWMEENNFSNIYLKDRLLLAEKLLEQVNYAEILRGQIQASNAQRFEARQALQLIDWNKIEYTDILVYTGEIESLKNRAINLRDGIMVVELRIENYPNLNLSVVENLLKEVQIALREERYNDGEELLQE